MHSQWSNLIGGKFTCAGSRKKTKRNVCDIFENLSRNFVPNVLHQWKNFTKNSCIDLFHFLNSFRARKSKELLIFVIRSYVQNKKCRSRSSVITQLLATFWSDVLHIKAPWRSWGNLKIHYKILQRKPQFKQHIRHAMCYYRSSWYKNTFKYFPQNFFSYSAPFSNFMRVRNQ